MCGPNNVYGLLSLFGLKKGVDFKNTKFIVRKVNFLYFKKAFFILKNQERFIATRRFGDIVTPLSRD